MKKKTFSAVAKVGVTTSLLVAPLNNVSYADTTALSNNPVDWSIVNFVPYTTNDGTPIYDPANEPGISPDDVDFTSGYAKGTGNKPSFYVGSDGSNLFFRMRLLGNPYARKGGFLSSVWLVDIGINGLHKATVGVNGKSPHNDYIYISNADGTITKNVNQTDSSGSNVPGTRISEADNGQYFLDFQVPISQITSVAPDVTTDSALQFFFGTSKAANLAVINKDYMGPDKNLSFSNLASVKIKSGISLYMPAISFTSPTTFDKAPLVITGTAQNAANGSAVSLTLNGQKYTTTVNNGVWSVPINQLTTGTYTASVQVTNELGNVAAAKQDISVGQEIKINGPAYLKTNVFPSVIKGSFTNATGGAKKVDVSVLNSSGIQVASSDRNQTDNQFNWQASLSVSNPLTKGVYTVKAFEDKTTSPIAVQQIELDPDTNVVLKSPANDTSSENARPMINGTSEANDQVEVFIDGNSYRTVKADENGNWECELDYALSTGTHTIKAIATDSFGNAATSAVNNYIVTSLDISIDNGAEVKINDPLPVLRGKTTAPNGSTVSVSITSNGDPEKSIRLSGQANNGKWSVTVPEDSPLHDGDYTVSAIVASGQQKATASQKLSVDSTTFVTIGSPVNNSSIQGTNVTISGTTETFSDMNDFETVTLNIDNGNKVVTVSSGTDGNWNYMIDGDLPYGKHTIIATASDPEGNEAEASVTFYVPEPNNQNPTLEDNTYNVAKNHSISGVFTGSDPDSNQLVYTKGSDPVHGTLTLGETGEWTYTPSKDYFGDDSFTVVVDDGHGGHATANIVVHINNSAPKVDDSSAETTKTKPVSGEVTGTDEDGDALTYALGTGPAHGTAEVNLDGSWTYTPNGDFTGTDTFTVTVKDNSNATATATVSVQVKEPELEPVPEPEVPKNTPPVLDQNTINISTDKNKTANGIVNATDSESDPLSYSVATQPKHGKVETGNDGTWTYAPDENFSGEDSFTITVDDGKGGTATCTITVQVKNTPPETEDVSAETTKAKPVSGQVTGTDKDGDTLTYTLTTGPAHGTAVVNPNGTWTYTPNGDFTGTDIFTVTVKDNSNATATATVSVQVKEPELEPVPEPEAPKNTPPVLDQNTINISTDKNKAANGKVNATDSEADPLSYSVATQPKHGKVETGNDGTWTYTPDENFSGEDSFTITVDDGKEGTATCTVTVQVKNTPPETKDVSAETIKTEPVSGQVIGTDKDDDTLTYTLGTGATHGTAEVNPNGSWTYTPNGDFTGTDTFTVTVKDNSNATATATVSVQVKEPEAPKNNPPVLDQNTINISTDKNKAAYGKVNVTDSDSDSLSYSVGTQPKHGKVETGNDGTWTYAPDENFSGEDSFTITVDDGKGGTATCTVTVQVKNTPPETEDVSAETTKAKPVSGQVTGTDKDGDTLTYTLTTGPAHGTAVVDPNGTWTYTPTGDFAGTDAFTVTVKDESNTTATATIMVQVKNIAPVAQNDSKTTVKNTPVSGKAQATDADGDPIMYSIGTDANHGTVSVTQDGSWSFTPNKDFVGTDSFTVKAADKDGGIAFSTILIQVKSPDLDISINGGTPIETVDATPLIKGTATGEVNGQVSIEIVDSNNHTVTSGEAYLNGDTWEFQTETVLPAGTYTVQATLSDIFYDETVLDKQTMVIVNQPAFIQLQPDPSSIVGDGKSRSIITAVVKDDKGNPIAGEKVVFSAEAGKLINSEATTDSEGKASVELISPDLSGTTETVKKQIKATVINPDKGLNAESKIDITFLPATIKGQVMNYDKPIAGALVEINEDFNKDGIIDFHASTITDANGEYDIAVPYGDWDYHLHITTVSEVNGREFPLEFNQTAHVGENTGTGADSVSEKTVTGQLLILNSDINAPDQLNSVFDNVEIVPVVLNDESKTLKVNVNPNGQFEITGGEKGKTYVIALNLKVVDSTGKEQTLVGQRISVLFPDDGVASIQSFLIDPYGTVKDSVTGRPLEDVKVELYWADTELNRQNGRTPNTLVNLPYLSGFGPNYNMDPQYTNENGQYAWMVFPEGDYYITASKDHYELYDSRTEGRNVPVAPGTDSYIQNGIIHVGQSILNYDFSLVLNENSRQENHEPVISNYTYNVAENSSLKEKVEGTDVDGDQLTYQKASSPSKGTAIVREDGSFVYTPLPGISGDDSFTIQVNDGKGGVAITQVMIHITANQELPVQKESFAIETFMNQPISGKLSDWDIQDAITIQANAPGYGTIEFNLADGTWTYRPSLNYIGKDQFFIHYKDVNGNEEQKTINITVHPLQNKNAGQIVHPSASNPAQTGTAVNNKNQTTYELPNTGMPIAPNMLLGLGGLLTAAGLYLRRLIRRKD